MKKNIIILIISLIALVALVETIVMQSFRSPESLSRLFSGVRFVRFALFNLAILLVLGGGWFLISRVLKHAVFRRRRSPVLSLKGRLISVFALVTFIPTVSLIFVSQLIIAQSINRWENVSNELKKLRVLPMVENAEGVASDFGLIQALENNIDLSRLDFGLPEGYIVTIYNAFGKMLFSSADEPALRGKLSSLEEVGLPSAREFQSKVPILPKEAIKLGDKELALSAMISQSPKDGRTLGIVLVGKIVPSAPADISRVRRTIVAVFALTAIFIFLIALWISSLIAREITDPIQKLVIGTREVAGGNLDYQVDIATRDEIGMLADSFNQMTVRLRYESEELKRAEKVAAWKEVAQKLAHEIKNPLTPIQLSAERLQRRYRSNPQGYEQILDECTNTIIDEAEKLRRLLDEFSQFARMPSISPVPSNINDVVHEAIKLYGEFPENVDVITAYMEDLPSVLVDPDQMRRAFFNIIKNAVEAMSDGGRLTVSTRSKDTFIQVEFADTGPGMSADAMGKLFTPHFSTKKGGAGLGLAIVNKIVTDHGGNVDVKSEDGKGATFIISIPVTKGAKGE